MAVHVILHSDHVICQFFNHLLCILPQPFSMPQITSLFLISVFILNNIQLITYTIMLRKAFGSFTNFVSKNARPSTLNHIRQPHPSIFCYRTKHYFSGNSQKIREILQNLKVETGGKQMSLQQSGLIKNQYLDPQTKKLSFQLDITKDYMKIKNHLKHALLSAGFVDVDISMAPKANQEKEKGIRKGNLSQIKKIIAVSSCKGGVGKSTVAINIAANLKNMGFKVGVFDSDIYGPSLPTLINKEGETLEPCEDNPKEIVPKQYEGLICMSFGFVGSKPAAMRGPMVSSIVAQLLNQTRWGELDFLVVDMPPGTGDIQISLCQQLKFDGAVIITTPQRLAFMDVIKGIEMFQQLRVRILGVVENMSYYECPKCGHKDEVFGKGYTRMMMDQFGIQNAFKIPLMSDITKYSDLGTPLAFVLPEQHKIRVLYNNICESVRVELEKPKINANAYYNKEQKAIIVEQQNRKKKIDPYTLRLKCKCAACIDQLSGAMLIKKEDIKPDVHPVRMEQKGNYAVAVVWSDGHRSSIYPFKRLFSEDIPEI